MDPLLIFGFILLFMLSAFFSGTELALMSLAPHKLETLLKEGKFGSKSLKKIKENNDRLLITILIGNNLVNVYTAALATTIAIGIATSAGNVDQSLAIGIATGVVTFLLLLFGEIIPKSIATKNAATISLLVAPIYKVLMLILYPVISFMEILIKTFSGKEKVEQITDEEIESFIDMGVKSGGLEEEEHEKLKSILEFGDISVEEIMTPRVKIERLSISSTVGEALEFYLSHTHSRIPVYDTVIDKIDHFVTIRELLNQDKTKLLSDLNLPKVLKVPLNKPIDKLLLEFQNARKHLAIVMDEYGGVAGLISLEDIVEEIFGEIRDETDIEVDDIKELGKNSIRVESDILIEDVLDKFNLELDDIGLDFKSFDGENLSYVITHILEGFPKKDQIITFDIINEDKKVDKILSCKVLGIENGKIGKVDIRVIKKDNNI